MKLKLKYLLNPELAAKDLIGCELSRESTRLLWEFWFYAGRDMIQRCDYEAAQTAWRFAILRALLLPNQHVVVVLERNNIAVDQWSHFMTAQLIQTQIQSSFSKAKGSSISSTWRTKANSSLTLLYNQLDKSRFESMRFNTLVTVALKPKEAIGDWLGRTTATSIDCNHPVYSNKSIICTSRYAGRAK